VRLRPTVKSQAELLVGLLQGLELIGSGIAQLLLWPGRVCCVYPTTISSSWFCAPSMTPLSSKH